ncbi:MAG: hypothetical protein R3E31_02895 [Chloroflexota bacterium]|nr:hypothetical protein [Anaerolineales bacterium]
MAHYKLIEKEKDESSVVRYDLLHDEKLILKSADYMDAITLLSRVMQLGDSYQECNLDGTKSTINDYNKFWVELNETREFLKGHGR